MIDSHQAMELRHPEGRILVFAKAPRPGQVKTRLIPRLGAKGAADLHRLLVTQTIATVSNARLAPTTLCCTPTCSDPFLAGLAGDADMVLDAQRGRDLGERMAQALTVALAEARYAVLVGTDCPAMDENYLGRALQALAGGRDAVVGPAQDGGYVLIGLSRAVAPALFRDIPWGSARVLDETRGRLKALGWSWEELPTLRDIDRPEDLDELWGPPLRLALH